MVLPIVLIGILIVILAICLMKNEPMAKKSNGRKHLLPFQRIG